jgi:putative cardiolipin synthase
MAFLRFAAALFLAAGLTSFAAAAESPLASWLTAPAADLSDPTAGNRLARLENGYDALLLRVHLIRQAQRSVSIQTFIWTNDECGRLLIYELIEAARRGVKVRILADHMVSDQDPDTVAFLATEHPNLEVKHYRPAMARLKPSLWHNAVAAVTSFRGLNQRMHNKVMLVDEAVLITGGRNIENTYYDHSTGMNFRDRDVVAAGPVVRAAVASFEAFWAYRHAVPSRELTDVAAAIAKGTFRRFPHRSDYDFGPHFKDLDREASDPALIGARFGAVLQPVRKVTFVADDPGKGTGFFSSTARITAELRAVLEKAETSIVMQTPYLVLSRPARKLLRELHAARPGLAVRISTNSFASTDNLFAYSANYRLRNEYVEDLHLRIFESKPLPANLLAHFPRHSEMTAHAARTAKPGRPAPAPFLCLHAKSLVVDGRIAFVGSYNLDPRSENLNTEVGLLVEDEAFARGLQAEIEADMEPGNSWVIARRALPLGLETVNGLVGDLLALSPIELWPVQNTSSFELRPGAAAVPPEHPRFHEHYRDVGAFPGTDGLLSTKEIVTRLYKAVGSPLTPIL